MQIDDINSRQSSYFTDIKLSCCRMLRVELLEKIRDERRFDTLEELRAQIEKDKEYILKLK